MIWHGLLTPCLMQVPQSFQRCTIGKDWEYLGRRLVGYRYVSLCFVLQHLTGEELKLITDFLRKRLSKVTSWLLCHSYYIMWLQYCDQ